MTFLNGTELQVKVANLDYFDNKAICNDMLPVPQPFDAMFGELFRDKTPSFVELPALEFQVED